MPTEVTPPGAMPEMQAKEVPQTKPLATQLEEAMAEMPKHAPKGMRSVKKPEVKAAVADDDAEPAPVAKPEPVSQEKLSSGFAKLERQRKAVAREEARIKADSDRVAAQLAEFDTNSKTKMSDLDRRQAEIDAILKLMDEDTDAFVDAAAKRKGISKDEVYDRWTRQRLNGGVQAPEDQIKKTDSEVRKEIEAIKAERAAEKEAAEKSAKESEQKWKTEQAFHAENAGLIAHVREPGKYPLLSKETDQNIVVAARQTVGSSRATFEEVAAHLEELLTFQKWKEEQAGKAETETPKTESAPKSEGKKTEPKKASTITNKMAASRTQKSEGTPRNDDERLERALSAWK
jgi:hypothetical protein